VSQQIWTPLKMDPPRSKSTSEYGPGSPYPLSLVDLESQWVEGPVVIYGGGVAPKRNVFHGKNFANSTIKKSKKFLPNFKNVTNGKLVTHVLYCFCDMSLITACAILWARSKVSCCLHMYFLQRHQLPPDKSENNQDSDSDWFIYYIDIWLLTLPFSLQYLSESWFGNYNIFKKFFELGYGCFVILSKYLTKTIV
jgi:hypothetical protein